MSAIHSERRYALKPFEASEEQYAFISYAHDDAHTIYPLIKELYEAGWNLWYDEGIRITERYLPEIAKHIKECEIFLLFVSERSIRRPFVMNFELEYAKKLGKRIVPVTVELVERMPERLAGLQSVTPDQALQGLLAESGLKSYGQREAVPPKDKKDAEYDLEQLTPMNGYEYRVAGEGIYLTKYTGKEHTVSIPGEHCGLPVMGLEGTFLGREDVIKVTVPESLQYVSDHLEDRFTLDHLARHVGISKRSLIRRFNEVLGHPPEKEITQIRINRAQELLIETDMPVGKIAIVLGYQASEYFIRVFQQHFGMTPKQFRMKARGT